VQSTKPQTIAAALNDSPAGLASWMLEKQRSWSDCGGDVETRFAKDDLLTTIMIFGSRRATARRRAFATKLHASPELRC
jgi:hypothetical protein